MDLVHLVFDSYCFLSVKFGFIDLEGNNFMLFSNIKIKIKILLYHFVDLLHILTYVG